MELSRQKIVLGLSVAVAIESAIGSGTIALTNAVPAAWIPTVTAWCGILAFIGSTIVAALAGSSIAASPSQAQLDLQAVVAKKVALAFLVAGLATFVACGHAEAQKKLTGDIAKDFGPKAASPFVPNDPFGDLMNQIEKIKADQIEGVIGALQEADTDAGAVINSATGDVKDPIAHACYPAQIKFLQSLPVTQPITAPAPYNLIVLFQRKRDFVAQVKAGLPPYLKIGCTALLGDEIQILIQTAALAGIKLLPAAASAMFPPLAPVLLPAMTLIP